MFLRHSCLQVPRYTFDEILTLISRACELVWTRDVNLIDVSTSDACSAVAGGPQEITAPAAAGPAAQCGDFRRQVKPSLLALG